MQFTIRDRYACGVTRFWEAMFFEPAYSDPLYREGLGFAAYQVLSLDREAGGGISRRIKVQPKLDAPAPIRKLIGDAITYEEVGRFDAQDRHFRSRIVPARLADKVTVAADLWLEPLSDRESDRVVQLTVEARVFGLGGLVERFLERTLRENYARSAQFTSQWLAAHPDP